MKNTSFRTLTTFLLLFTTLNSFSQYSIDPRIRASSIIIQSNLGVGSGFFLQDTLTKYMYLATASHVLISNTPKPQIPDTIFITGYRENVDTDSTFRFKISIADCLKTGNLLFDFNNDIALIRFAKLVDMGTFVSTQYPPFVTKLTKETKIESWPVELSVSIEDIIPGSDLFVIGFPQSLGLQGNFDMNRPLMRKGIVAGKDLKLNRIIGDGAVYFGNSGGIAVAIYFKDNKFDLRLAGLVSQYIPFDESLFDKRGNQRSIDYRNSGYSVIIPSNSILSLIKQFR
ncbi:MAG: trypsin-like peptidase domain-containing protein [Chitinophagaceae bacterium]|nr:trypsin-like peptidase domain-containing protein [Chitinophagaceae bacterium]